MSFTDSDAKRATLSRQTYVRNMTNKFAPVLNSEIKKISMKDLKMRDVKNINNPDRLFDYMRINQLRSERPDSS
mgnify:CR=1 FL=1